ncbi:hypothetical protein P7K49_004406 [Saguinus oedipus]|uniref:Uncharacterized protein n=1 Tax=Saguinus oedipus TaxID=9490 RepID=A0ABQ9W7Q2_SAGOE|nr:hypothetical protein P7K49_004406 [Saguinus oedipus]
MCSLIWDHLSINLADELARLETARRELPRKKNLKVAELFRFNKPAMIPESQRMERYGKQLWASANPEWEQSAASFERQNRDPMGYGGPPAPGDGQAVLGTGRAQGTSGLASQPLEALGCLVCSGLFPKTRIPE